MFKNQIVFPLFGIFLLLFSCSEQKEEIFPQESINSIELEEDFESLESLEVECAIVDNSGKDYKYYDSICWGRKRYYSHVDGMIGSDYSYQWTIDSGNATIVGSSTSNSVEIDFPYGFNKVNLTFSVKNNINSQACSEILEVTELICDPPCDLFIDELTETCYPSCFEFGRYKLRNYPEGAEIKWSIRNATFVNTYYDEVYVSADSQYKFTIIAEVDNCVYEKVVTPRTDCANDCGGGGPAPF
ncbi:hypothetical protein OO013_06440 [Mangrovivirga sp. M17]|uniref:PKD domain-containing protein n=1 Tax=Mangrovivirga halotolerans TaxID=2993936 RepID=A0ABT3RNV7_9BACT|nr:hypothetical protein [Mangrovivirga halotolerans]MCX2743495.1 hypothetical protein [Mangrovivirga halotolerans]